MTIPKDDKSFLGRGWHFPPAFGLGGNRVEMVVGEEDIDQSLRILLATKPGERVMQPSYGCGINALVFESISESTVTEIKDMVERAILFFEPRIDLKGLEIDASEIYEGKLTLLIDYSVRATNSRNNMVYPFYFKEGTNLRSQEIARE